MKNKLFPVLFAFPFTAGICAASIFSTKLRYLEGAVSSETPLTQGLIAVCCIAILMALISAFLLKNGIEYSTKLMPGALSVSMWFGAGCLLIHAFLTLLPLRYEFHATQLILALFSLYGAVSLIVLAKYRLCERDSSAYCIFSAVPSFWAAFMTILTFRNNVTEPVILNYVFLVLAYISILFFSYSLAAHVLGKGKKNVAVFSCFMGIFFILTEIIGTILAGGFEAITLKRLTEFLPMIAYLVFMPFATAEILKKR